MNITGNPVKFEKSDFEEHDYSNDSTLNVNMMFYLKDQQVHGHEIGISIEN